MSTSPSPDYVVVGSGPSGTMAARRLVLAGRRVLMLDGGETDQKYASLIPEKPFAEIRRQDAQQHRYFLGDQFEGIGSLGVRVGAQLTPPRQHLNRRTDEFLPVASPQFQAMRSLALGGLGAGWGAGAFRFIDEELRMWPIGTRELSPHYDEVTRHIGVAGESDDLRDWFGPADGLFPAPDLDSNAAAILKRYQAARTKFLARGFTMGRPRLALCTTAHEGRGPLSYTDMDFWADHRRAFYRPQFTVEALRDSPLFEYRPQHIVRRLEQTPLGILIHVEGSSPPILARRVFLGAGTLETARIVLASLNTDASVPIVSNPYTYFPCVNLPMLGRVGVDARHSMTQLSGVFDPDGTRSSALQAQFYSYRSLLNFKLVKEAPLAVPDAIRLMRLLQESFVIVGVHHPDHPATGKNLRLNAGTLAIQYDEPVEVVARRDALEARLKTILRGLHCFPLRAIRPGAGSSIHYGGTFPMTSESRPLSSTPPGELRDLPGVYVVDGSGFPTLPAKGLTLTLMANADRVAAGAARSE